MEMKGLAGLVSTTYVASKFTIDILLLKVDALNF